MRNFKRVLLVFIFAIFSHSMFALGLPQRLYPVKVIKKSFQVLVRKVSR